MGGARPRQLEDGADFRERTLEVEMKKEGTSIKEERRGHSWALNENGYFSKVHKRCTIGAQEGHKSA